VLFRRRDSTPLLESLFVALAQLGTRSHYVHFVVPLSNIGQQGNRGDYERLANPARQPPNGLLVLKECSECILYYGVLHAAGHELCRIPNRLECAEMGEEEVFGNISGTEEAARQRSVIAISISTQ